MKHGAPGMRNFCVCTALGVCGLMLSCTVLADPVYPRPWGQSGYEGAEVYHSTPGPRRYNPWEKFRQQPDNANAADAKSETAPRYRERKKPVFTERKLPQFYDGRGVPSENYPLQAPGYAPYGWGGMGVPMMWGTPYQPMYPGGGFRPWGYGGW